MPVAAGRAPAAGPLARPARAPRAPAARRAAPRRGAPPPRAAAAAAEALPLALAAAGVAAAALAAADPARRRAAQTAEAGGDELAAVRGYFNAEGFERWRKIYGEGDDVNRVQRDIRDGHAQTVEKVLAWIDADAGGVAGLTVADCGCGTGALAVPLALRGAAVAASDISSSMAAEAARRYEAAAAAAPAERRPATPPRFEATDLESARGRFHTVACLDVMIHYPQGKADAMVAHLASLAEERLILSFAPYTPALALLKRVGELFPGPSKATRAYLHAEADVEAALGRAGFEVARREMTSTSFYFSRLLEARRVRGAATGGEA
jgi:magnesium-protoporphyrin O-methyltransferase